MSANPAGCIVIEDWCVGIQGAVAAGMTAIGDTGGGHTYAEHTAVADGCRCRFRLRRLARN